MSFLINNLFILNIKLGTLNLQFHSLKKSHFLGEKISNLNMWVICFIFKENISGISILLSDFLL